jgi:antitoxin YefM
VLDKTYVNTYVVDGGSSEMTILNASDARANLYRLIDQTNESHEPVIISGKRNNAILLSEDDWNSIQETLYLTSIPGMRESIVEGMKEPLSESSKELDW